MTVHAISDAVEVPADRHTELAVLAACLDSKVARDEARKALTASDFYYPQHADVWEAMRKLDGHGKSVDPVTVSAILTPGTLAHALLPDLVTQASHPDGIADYAGIVRSWAQKRRVQELATRAHQKAMMSGMLPAGFAATIAAEFAAVRDAGADDVEALTLAELLDLPEQDYDWIIPGLLERGDRLMVTGEEGLGKSSLLRQIAILAAAGIHPFLTSRRIEPIKALIYDAENTRRQFVRKAATCTRSPASTASTPARGSWSRPPGASTSPATATWPGFTACATRCSPTCSSSARCTGSPRGRSTPTTRRARCWPRWTRSRTGASRC